MSVYMYECISLYEYICMSSICAYVLCGSLSIGEERAPLFYDCVSCQLGVNMEFNYL